MPRSSLLNYESEYAYLRAAPAERHDAGRSQRETVPLEAHVEAALETGRTDPLTILAEQDKSRLAELIPLRYGRMSRTPFTFLRGAAAIMASDLAAGARTDLRVELCGDAHLGNFRWYNAPDRELVFDLNDFDETLPGPFEWDLKRLAASITVAARANGFSNKQARTATRSAMRNYRKSIAVSSELDPLALYYYRRTSHAALNESKKHGKKYRKLADEILAKATSKNSLRAYEKLTDVVDGRRTIVPDPPLVVRVDHLVAATELAAVGEFLDHYRHTLSHDRRLLLDRFSLVDIAKKVVGVGSVGTTCLIVLLQAGDGTPLFLQFKQATSSVLETHLGASAFDHAGQRVVEGQRRIQATSDVFLGWARWQRPDGEEIDFYLRQLWDGKGKIDTETLGPKQLAVFAGVCGKALAFAHARSGDAMMIRGYIGDNKTFDKVMVEYADRYADITERDQTQLCEAINDGAIEVVRDI